MDVCCVKEKRITPEQVAAELLAVSPSDLRREGLEAWGYQVHLSDEKGELECWGSELQLAEDGGGGFITFGRKDAGDPEFVAITGGSAGGHLSSLAALTANEPEFQPGFEEADTSVVAAVPFYGVYDWINRDGTGRADMEEFLGKYVLKASRVDQPELWEKASTMSWVRPDAPPFFIIHGTNDTLVPVEQARAFAALLQGESKNPVVYAELDGAQHAFEMGDSPRTFATVRAVHRFLETIRAREGHTGVGAAL